MPVDRAFVLLPLETYKLHDMDDFSTALFVNLSQWKDVAPGKSANLLTNVSGEYLSRNPNLEIVDIGRLMVYT